MKIAVTGGAGFIGSAFVRLAVKSNYEVCIIDKLTYAGDLARLKEVKKQVKFYKADITDKKKVEAVLKKELPDVLVNFAAETHVDRSIVDSSPFLLTNVLGTQVLIDACRRFGVMKFVHISTDEVYGEIESGSFTENSALSPNSPYAASKAAADLLIKSYVRTFEFPAIIVRPSNNYGPWQYPEKFIPRAIMRLLKQEKIPVYGDGRNVREWLYVDDCAEGVLKIIEKGKCGQVYNIGSNQEKQNIEVARMLIRVLSLNEEFITFVKDRLGHDIRYRLDSKKVALDVQWSPKIDFERGLQLTVDWYKREQKWLSTKWEEVATFYK